MAESSHVRCLEENRVYVENNLVIGSDMIEHLLAEDVIGYSDSCRSDIDNASSDDMKNSRLIDVLLQKDEKTFDTFVKILDNVDYKMSHVSAKLREKMEHSSDITEERQKETLDICDTEKIQRELHMAHFVIDKRLKDGDHSGSESSMVMLHCPDRMKTLSSCKSGQKKDITHYHHIEFGITHMKHQYIYRIKAEPVYADYGQMQIRKCFDDFRNIEIIHCSYNDCQLEGLHRHHYDIWLCFISTGYQVEYGMEFTLMEKSKDNKECPVGQPIFHKFLVSATELQELPACMPQMALSGRLQNKHYIATIKRLTDLTEGKKVGYDEFYMQKSMIEHLFGASGNHYRPEYIASIKLVESKVAYMNSDLACAKRLAKQAASYCMDIPGADGLALGAYCLHHLSCHYRFQKNWEKTESVLDKSFQQVLLLEPGCDLACSYFNCGRMFMDQSAMYLDRLKEQSEHLRHMAVDMFKKAVDVLSGLDSLENPVHLNLLQRTYLNMAMTYLNVPYHASLQPITNPDDMKKAEECLLYIQRNLMHDIYDRTKCHVLKLQANLEFMKGNVLQGVNVMEQALCLALDSQLSLDVKFCKERLDAMKQSPTYNASMFKSKVNVGLDDTFENHSYNWQSCTEATTSEV